VCDHGAMFEIGDSLREARQRRSIAYAQAELATKIRSKYLRALEDEQFDQLPSPTYVKGFLQAYADFLGLDGQLYVDEYNSRYVVGDDWDGPRRSTVRPDRRERGMETSIVVVALVLITIVTVVIISAWQVSGSPTKPRPPAKPAPKADTAHIPTAALEIEALSGGSYVEVHRGGPGGRILFAGTVEKGHLEPFRGSEFWVSVSAPENLAIIVGGRRVALSGDKPEALIVSQSGVRPD
jgi:cytoskeleton protein RodZ